LCFLLLSCGASDKLTRMAASAIDGKWVLNTVNYETEAKGTLDIKMFNGIPFACLENTDWDFISNNNRGAYRLNNESCTDIPEQYFIWYIPKEMFGFNHSMMLKPVNEKYKSVLNDKGYRMELLELEKKTMTWSYETLVNNKKLVLKLDFIKL